MSETKQLSLNDMLTPEEVEKGELEFNLFEEVLPLFETTVIQGQIVYMYKGKSITDLFWKIVEGTRVIDKKLAKKGIKDAK